MPLNLHSTVVLSVCSAILALATSSKTLARTDVDPYTLCAQYPSNSVCQPYHLDPVALSERSGEDGLACVLNIDSMELQGRCKYVIEPEQTTIYIEDGDELDSLDDNKPTQIVQIPTRAILKLFYQEDTAKVRRSLANIIPPVRIARRLFTSPEEISLMSIVFATDAAAAPTPPVVTMVVQREQGAEVRSQLETITGLPSEAPPATE